MKKIGLEVEELERIFAQLKQKNEVVLQSRIYNAYLPLIGLMSKKFEVNEDDIHDIYNDVFSYVYNSVMRDVISAKDFTVCFQNLMAKQCVNKKTDKQNNVTKESLSSRLIVQETERVLAEREKSQEIARRSLLMVVAILEKISNDPQLAKEYGLDKEHIKMIRDFHGINRENKSLKLIEIAQKYNITEARAKAMLVAGLKKFRELEELDPIKNRRV